MTNDPIVPPYQPFPQQPQPPQYGHYPQQPQPPQYGQYPQQPQPPQYGQYPQQPVYGQNQPCPPQFQQGPNPPQGFGPPPQSPAPGHGPEQPKGPFGPSFWIVGSLLALIVLSNTVTGRGEAILIFLGIAAVLTGLYSLIFKKRSWAALPGRNVAVTVVVAGAASLLFGGIAAGVDGGRVAAATQPVTSATLEADAAARLKAREDAVVKAEEAVKAREAAVTGAEKAAAANTVGDGVWTVGKDMPPGDYRTTKGVASSCYWSITRTGSNGGDIIQNDIVPGGFPMVTLAEGQTFKSSRCGAEWKKQ